MGSSKTSFGVLGICSIIMAMVILAGGVAGQGPAAAPTPDCGTVVFELVDCLPFVMGSATTPPATCCSNLSSIVTSSPQCLCQLYNTTFTEPLGVNVTAALRLPAACKVSTPDPSSCNAYGIPVPGPASSTGPATAPAPPMAPSSTPASTPSAAAPVMTPTPATTATPATTPTTAQGPAGLSPAGETSPSLTAPPPSPSSAPYFVVKGAAAVSSSILALALFLI